MQRWIEYDEFYPRASKPILDAIDTVLAQHYGFTEGELDFVINYDIKYRMGAGTEGGEREVTQREPLWLSPAGDEFALKVLSPERRDVSKWHTFGTLSCPSVLAGATHLTKIKGLRAPEGATGTGLGGHQT